MPRDCNIKVRRSTTASAVPGASALDPGEFAVNLTDSKLFCGNAAGTSYIELTRRASGLSSSSSALYLQLASTEGMLTSAISLTYDDTARKIDFAGHDNTLDIVEINSGEGIGLRISGATSGGGSAIGAIRLGRHPTSTNNVYMRGSGGNFEIMNGINAAGGTSMLFLDKTNAAFTVGLSVLSLNGSAFSGPAAEIRLYRANGAAYTGFKASNTASSFVYTLPTADGSSGQVLSTDGSGTLSWASAGGAEPVGSILSLYSLGII